MTIHTTTINNFSFTSCCTFLVLGLLLAGLGGCHSPHNHPKNVDEQGDDITIYLGGDGSLQILVNGEEINDTTELRLTEAQERSLAHFFRKFAHLNGHISIPPPYTDRALSLGGMEIVNYYQGIDTLFYLMPRDLWVSRGSGNRNTVHFTVETVEMVSISNATIVVIDTITIAVPCTPERGFIGALQTPGRPRNPNSPQQKLLTRDIEGLSGRSWINIIPREHYATDRENSLSLLAVGDNSRLAQGDIIGYHPTQVLLKSRTGNNVSLRDEIRMEVATDIYQDYSNRRHGHSAVRGH